MKECLEHGFKNREKFRVVVVVLVVVIVVVVVVVVIVVGLSTMRSQVVGLSSCLLRVGG